MPQLARRCGGELDFSKVYDGFSPPEIKKSSSLAWMASEKGGFRGGKPRQTLRRKWWQAEGPAGRQPTGRAVSRRPAASRRRYSRPARGRSCCAASAAQVRQSAGIARRLAALYASSTAAETPQYATRYRVYDAAGWFFRRPPPPAAAAVPPLARRRRAEGPSFLYILGVAPKGRSP